MLTLHHNPMSCSLASLFALEEASAPFSVVTVDLAAGEQTTAAYLAINPKGRVPALRTERGVLTETPAILTYVAQRFPQAALLPLHDGFEHARVQSFMSWVGDRAVVPVIRDLHESSEALRLAELERARRLLARGDDIDAVLEALSKGLTAKFLHGPQQALHHAQGDERARLAALLPQLFRGRR